MDTRYRHSVGEMMTARQIVDSLIARQHLASTRKKDVLTSLRKLAAASDVGLDDLDLAAAEHTYPEILKAYFDHLDPVPSVHTQRNTFQNIAQLYRAMHDGRMLRQAPPQKWRRITNEEARRHYRETSPYRSRSSKKLSPYGVHKDQWPADIRQHWEDYRTEKSFDVRAATIEKYENFFGAYVSYNLQFEDPAPTTWDQLFEVARLRRWVQWHAARVDASWTREMGATRRKTRITRRGKDVVDLCVLLARYEKRLETEALIAFRSKLPVVESWHRKTDPIHAVTPRELEDLGLRLLDDARRPIKREKTVRRNGIHRAITCQTALMIRLWWRVPIRSRSMREMDIALPGVYVPSPRLYQDEHGTWQLRYEGEQLKIGERRGRTNEFRVPFPPDLVPHLEEYLRVFRPMMPCADTNPHLWLGRDGTTPSKALLRDRLTYTVYSAIGKRIYPHLLRTIWTDAYLLSSGGDIDTAAYMLNDNPATVLQHYHELVGERQVAKAYAFNQAILGNSNRKTP
jgi:hypothetical protein